MSDFGLLFFNARWVDPLIGRFTSPDSIIPENQGTQAWDRYAFVNNNPLRYTDPTGHMPWDIDWWAVTKFMVGRYIDNGKITKSDWVDAANTYAPAKAPGSQVSSQYTLGGGPGVVLEINIVTHHEGEIQAFVSTGSGTVSPQADVSVSSGHIWGDEFERNGTKAFGGESDQIFGGISAGSVGISADGWSSPDGGVFGVDGGMSLGASPTLSGGIVHLQSRPMSTVVQNIFTFFGADEATTNYAKLVAEKLTHIQPGGAELLACRAIELCGY